MLAFERVLIGCALPLGSAIQTWGVVAAVGASHAAFYLASLLGVMYFALAMPLPSSFRKADVAASAIGTLPKPPAHLHLLSLSPRT